MKTAVSPPDELFQRVEEAARRARVPRSRFCAAALAENLARREARSVTQKLDEVYGDGGEGLEAGLDRAQRRVVEPEEW
jgi:predicted transcriptional regulator